MSSDVGKRKAVRIVELDDGEGIQSKETTEFFVVFGKVGVLWISIILVRKKLKEKQKTRERTKTTVKKDWVLAQFGLNWSRGVTRESRVKRTEVKFSFVSVCLCFCSL